MESLISNNEKIDGHHMYKRKRKYTAFEESKSYSRKAMLLNSKSPKAKTDDHVDIPTRAVGGDGHFYVCVMCNDVGELLCCDTCSCTYHLHCLDPPLASTPEGDWQCQNCSINDKLSEKTLDFESALCNKILSLNGKSSASSICSLCSKTKKVLILSEDEAFTSKFSKCSSADRPNLSVGFGKLPMESHGGPSVADAEICGTSIQQAPNKVKYDKLLILRDVLEEMVDGLDKPKQNNNEEIDTTNQLDLLTTVACQGQKDKYAKVRTRQKDKSALRNRSKGDLSGSRLDERKQSSNLRIVKYSESAQSDDLASNRKGADGQRSSSMTVSGQGITVPSISLHKKDGSATGFASSRSYGKSIDTMTPGKPSGFLKRNVEKNAWSELELDALWVGVRRHGQGNWDTILADPSLRLLKNKTPEDLSMKWNEELLKIFPSLRSTSSVLSAIPERSLPPLSDATTTQFLHPKSPSWCPVGVANQSSMSMYFIPSVKYGILCSQNQGSSSRVSHSFQKADSAPQWRSSNSNTEPSMASELVFQTPNQRANIAETNMGPMRMQALKTPAAAMGTKTKLCSTRTEPNLLLGGHFPISRVGVDHNASGPSNTKPNPSQVETDEEY